MTVLQSLRHLCGPSLVQQGDAFLVLGSPELDPELQMRLTSSKQRGRTTAVHLRAMLFLMQPKMLLAFFAARAHRWLKAIFFSTGILRSFFAKLLSTQLSPSLFCDQRSSQVRELSFSIC